MDRFLRKYPGAGMFACFFLGILIGFIIGGAGAYIP